MHWSRSLSAGKVSDPECAKPSSMRANGDWVRQMNIVSLAGRRAITQLESRDVKDPSDQARTRSATAAMADEDDNARFSRLVLPYLADAYSVARWITGNRADGEDVVQEASLRAFRSIRSTTGENPRAWVLTIVRNTAYTWLRKNRRPALVDVESLEAAERMQTVPGDEMVETPESALIAKANAADLETAISALSAPLREVVVLRDVHGLSYREIADAVDVPIGTVMSRLARGRGQVMAKIGRRAS
jgi:RNA polymerase sigma factor (sigma-70 family)